MSRKRLYKCSKRGGVLPYRFGKERKHSRPKNTARGYRSGRASRPPRVPKTNASPLNPSVPLDGTKHDIVLIGLEDSRPLRRRMVVPMIDTLSRMVVGLVVVEEMTVKAPENLPIILADNGTACRSRDVCYLLGSLGVRLLSARPARPDYETAVERCFASLGEVVEIDPPSLTRSPGSSNRHPPSSAARLHSHCSLHVRQTPTSLRPEMLTIKEKDWVH